MATILACAFTMIAPKCYLRESENHRFQNHQNDPKNHRQSVSASSKSSSFRYVMIKD